jgi:multicomponent K+:H+ antiporter subunit A
MDFDFFLPLATLLSSLVPTIVIFLLPETAVWPRQAMNLAGAGLKLVFIAIMLQGVFHEHQYEFRFAVLPGIDFILRADPLAMFFVTLSALLWFVTTIYAITYLEHSTRRRRFFGFFSLCVSSTVGIALAGNLLTFILFYELLTLSTYPLVVHDENDKARRAGRIYLAYTFVGGALLVLGATWLHAIVPTVEFQGGAALANVNPSEYPALRWIFALMVAGVGVKAALVPLHGWLPQAMVAPAPVSALLHAVAVVKAGVFGVVRIVYDVYGIDFANALGVTFPLAIVASTTIIYGSIRALFQDDLKRRLAFSTVSQVSYIALGVAIAGPSSTIGGVAHLVHQGLMKITLFFCAGNFAVTLGVYRISQMHGIGRRMPLTMAAFTVAALGMIGVPPIAGFISKWYLAAGAVEASQLWVLLVLASSAALNAAYFLPILCVGWFGKPNEEWNATPLNKNGSVQFLGRSIESPVGLLLPTLLTGIAALMVGLLAGLPFSPLHWSELVVARAYGRTVPPPGGELVSAGISLGGIALLVALATPIVLTLMLPWNRYRPQVLCLASVAALPALLVACFVEEQVSVDLPGVLLHTHLALDAIGRTFLGFTALLWLVAGVFAFDSLRQDPRRSIFFGWFLMTMAGNLGLVLSQDMVSFYFFFAVMSYSSYGLVVFHKREQDFLAGRVYLTMVAAGEVVLFVGIVLATYARGSLFFDQGAARLADSPYGVLAIGFLLAGFAFKVGVIPLHVSLPLAYRSAPIPAAAVLAGAMIKAGILGWIRFLPNGESAFSGYGTVLIALGCGAALLGPVLGLVQTSAKAVLAYSSVSQMGVLTIALGHAFLYPEKWPVTLLAMIIFSINHALCKGCLFLNLSMAPARFASRSGSDSISTKSWKHTLRWIGLLPAALSLAGAPLTLGSVSKTSVKAATKGLAGFWGDSIPMVYFFVSLGTTLLLARYFWLMRSWESDEVLTEPRSKPRYSIYAWWALVFAIVFVVWFSPDVIRLGPTGELIGKTISLSGLLPLSLGIILAALVWVRAVGKQDGSTETVLARLVPPGDVVYLWLKMNTVIRSTLESALPKSDLQASPSTRRSASSKIALLRRLAGDVETRLDHWPAVGLAIILVVIAGVASVLRS